MHQIETQLRELLDLVRVALGTEEMANRLRASGAQESFIEPVQKMAAEHLQQVRRAARSL